MGRFLDPNAYEVVDAPAPATGGRFLDPSQFEEIPAAAPIEVQPTRDVSMLESAARGAGQGATLGLLDEAIGAGKALFAPFVDQYHGRETRDFGSYYREGRDQERKANAEARAANPWTFAAGDVAGSVATSFVPGLNVAKGASWLKVAGNAALQGGISGVGTSEAEDLGGVVKDAATSAAISGTTAGLVSKILKNAPKRAAERIVGDFTDGVPATMRDRIVGKGGKHGATEANNFNGSVVRIAKESPTIKAAGRDPGRLVEAIDTELTPTMAAIDDMFAASGRTTGGIPAYRAWEETMKVAKGLESNPATRQIAQTIKGQADDIYKTWIEPAADRATGFVDKTPHVTAQQMREFASALGDVAFQGSPGMPAKQGKQIAQKLWGAMKDIIDENIDEMAEKIGSKGSAELKRLNQRASTLINMRQGALYRGTREATESTRLKDRIGGGLDIGLALVDPSTFFAKKAYDYVGKPLARKADDKLAEIVEAAQRGEPWARVKERAIVMGISPVAAQALYTYINKTLNNLGGTSEAQP